MNTKTNAFKSSLLIILIYVFGITSVYPHGVIQSGVEPIDINVFPAVEEDMRTLSAYGAVSKAAGIRMVECVISPIFPAVMPRVT